MLRLSKGQLQGGEYQYSQNSIRLDPRPLSSLPPQQREIREKEFHLLNLVKLIFPR
jgi:hypothetical protein